MNSLSCVYENKKKVIALTCIRDVSLLFFSPKNQIFWKARIWGQCVFKKLIKK